ncbi:uncharacterized protein LOC144129542 [Amblyomma americanum]|uniref:THAP-type domain-containing protein n=1 Tax=Amblyomma americanum TaxID=6943 RepID=A0AAQ4E3S3_AMBAM
MAAHVSAARKRIDGWPKKGRNRRYCCVHQCHNEEGLDKDVTFYSFSGKANAQERRQRWIQAVRRARRKITRTQQQTITSCSNWAWMLQAMMPQMMCFRMMPQINTCFTVCPHINACSSKHNHYTSALLKLLGMKTTEGRKCQ